jgi:hypothetical protein
MEITNRALLKGAGEAKTDKLSKSQITRGVERCLKEKKLRMNQIRKALGRPERDDSDDEDDEEEEEEETAAASSSNSNGKGKGGEKGPVSKKAKTTPTQTGGGSSFIGGIVNALLSPVAAIFSPGKPQSKA